MVRQLPHDHVVKSVSMSKAILVGALSVGLLIGCGGGESTAKQASSSKEATAASSPPSVQDSKSCEVLKQGVKELCTRTLNNEPVWMSCSFYYHAAFEVLRKGGDEQFTLEDHCRSLHDTMGRVRENKKGSGESAEAIPASNDPKCPAQREHLLENCLGLFDSDELPADLELAKCAGRLGLFQMGEGDCASGS